MMTTKEVLWGDDDGYVHLARSEPKNQKCPNRPQNTIFGVLGGAQDASQGMGDIGQKENIPTVVTLNFARVQSAS